MNASFSTALSALSAHSTAVDVVGNNLANLNTTGFKASVISFRDLVTQSAGPGVGDTQVGFGVGRPITTRQFTQGGIQSSSGLLDAAIKGEGFLILKGGLDETLYTRAGNLHVDKDGRLLTLTGERVQGWNSGADGDIDVSNTVGDIIVPVGSLSQPRATASVSLDCNLDATATAGDTFTTPIQVYDSLGAAHVLKVTFTKSATPATGFTSTWTYQVTIPSEEVGGTAGTTTDLLTTPGELSFDENGNLGDPAAADASPVIPVAGLANGAADLAIDFSLFSAGKARVTQFDQPSAVSANSQDGISSAQLLSVGIGDGGDVLALYSNGRQAVVAKIALASIRNPDSLMASGNNNFQTTAVTSLPAVGEAGTGGRGQIIGGSLEASTVDIAREFTNLIVFQRGFQANARIISAVDELSQETINLRR